MTMEQLPSPHKKANPEKIASLPFNKMKAQRDLFEDERIGANEKLVWLNLAFYFHNEQTGRCDPSILIIAQRTGLSRSTVKRAMRKLEKFGWLAVERQRGRKTSNSYHPTHFKGGSHGTVKVVHTEPQTEYPNSKAISKKLGKEIVLQGEWV